MKWSWKIAKVAGIDVYLHMTFLILIVWIGLGYWQLAGTVAAVVSGVSFILALFFCVLLHEFGHALTARQFGIRTKSIMLLPIGGIASIEKMPEDPRLEILIALAGPAVSSAIALVLWIVLSMGNGLVPLEDLSVTGGSFLQRLMIINILLAAFNMLPAFPMDGGRVFRALLSLRMEPVKATRIAAVVAQEMQSDVPQADISEPLEAVMERMQAGESGLLIVTDGSRIAGIIDIDNIMELLRIDKALRKHDEHRW